MSRFDPAELTQPTGTISKSSFVTPQSGHTQLSGMSSQRVPGAIPSSGSPSASLYVNPQTTHIQVRFAVAAAVFMSGSLIRDGYHSRTVRPHRK